MTEPIKPVPSELRLKRLYCLHAQFEQALVPIDPEPPRPHDELAVGLGVGFKIDEEDSAHLGVQLAVSIEPDEDKHQPYRVYVAYVGEFHLSEALWGLDKEALAKANCAAILLPFVRQTVSDLTSRGTNGPVLLQPLNVAAMLESDDPDPESAGSPTESDP